MNNLVRLKLFLTENNISKKVSNNLEKKIKNIKETHFKYVEPE